MLAPNTWMEIKGVSLAPQGNIRTWQHSDFVNDTMPVQLDGVSVTVNGKAAYVAYVSPIQVNILTPPGSVSGAVQVQLTNNGVTSNSFSLPSLPRSPVFFLLNGGPYVAALHPDGSLLGPATLYPGLTTPARPGETIAIYGTGFGTTDVPVIGGSITQSGTLSPLPLITVGGVSVLVSFAGLVAPGEFQFNVTLPATLADGDQQISAAYYGSATQANALITVKR